MLVALFIEVGTNRCTEHECRETKQSWECICMQAGKISVCLRIVRRVADEASKESGIFMSKIWKDLQSTFRWPLGQGPFTEVWRREKSWIILSWKMYWKTASVPIMVTLLLPCTCCRFVSEQRRWSIPHFQWKDVGLPKVVPEVLTGYLSPDRELLAGLFFLWVSKSQHRQFYRCSGSLLTPLR